MKLKWNRLCAVGLLVCLMVSLAGCRKVVIAMPLNDKELFEINSETCSLKEAKVYLTTLQDEYQSFYDIDLWQVLGDESADVVDYVKDKTMYRLQNIYCMYLLALDRGIELTSEETSVIDAAAVAYYESLNEDELDYLGVTKDDIAEYYTHFAYANKVFDDITADVNLEISDDEARVMQAQLIYTTDATKAATVTSQLAAGTDFASLASTYSELSEVTTYVARGDLPEEVETVLFSLDEGTNSECITTSDGYYFVKCITKIDEEKTQENREKILQEAYEEAFDTTYEEFLSTLSFEVNEELWESIELQDNESITTTSFFTTYNEQMAGN